MKSLSYLNKYFIKYKWRLLLGVLFIVGTNYLYVVMPLIVKRAVNTFKEGFDPETGVKSALYLGGIYMALSLGKGILLFFTRQTIIMVSRFMEYDLKNEIYEHYQKLNFNFYKENSIGDLLNRISEDVSKVRQYLGPGVMYTINLVVLVGFTLSFMMNISVELTIYTLLPLPLMSFIIYKVSSIVNRQSEQVQRQQSRISSIVQETFAGIAVVKAFRGEKNIQQEFDEDADVYLGKHMALVKTDAFFMPTMTFLIGLSTILTIYYGGLLTFETQSSLTAGDIVAFIFYVNMLTWPFASIGWVTSIVQRAAASQERINEFLKETPEVTNSSEEAFEFDGNVVFDNVSYSFDNSGIEAVKNINFTIEKGKTLAILGRTGSGKSTILNLLMRNFDPTSGVIKIANKNLKDINLYDYRKQIGVVPQEVLLFSDTIKNNVCFGLPDDEDVKEEEVIEMLKMSHVWHNIEEFKDGMDTLLGERGVNLSGGQKQRISIARALIKKPKLLILDDCLSAVDTETEEIILNNFKNMEAEQTRIIVSHRVSTLRNADKIIVLDAGEIVENGTHQELIDLNGIYAEVYHKQLLEDQNKGA